VSRQHSAIPEPTKSAVERVPNVDCSTLELSRVSSVEFARPWWFASRDADQPEVAGRFDLEAPAGTCYFADTPIGALIEKLTDPADLEPLISTATLASLQVWQGRVPAAVAIADTTDRRSRIPKELGASASYERTWAWADALYEDGRQGIRWWLRLDPGPGQGIAFFGPASAPDALPDPIQWPTPPRCASALGWRHELADSFDLVDDPPSLDELEVAAFE
jgi:hypothetical protein